MGFRMFMGPPTSQQYTQSYKNTIILLFVSDQSVEINSKSSMNQSQFSSLLKSEWK